MNDRSQARNICQPSEHTLSQSAFSRTLSVPLWLFGALLVTRCSCWLLGILVTRRPNDCLALSLTTRRPPGHIGCKYPKTIDAARESVIFRHDKPSACTFALAVKCVCCVDICRGVGLDKLITECLVVIKLLYGHDGM